MGVVASVVAWVDADHPTPARGDRCAASWWTLGAWGTRWGWSAAAGKNSGHGKQAEQGPSYPYPLADHRPTKSDVRPSGGVYRAGRRFLQDYACARAIVSSGNDGSLAVGPGVGPTRLGGPPQRDAGRNQATGRGERDGRRTREAGAEQRDAPCDRCHGGKKAADSGQPPRDRRSTRRLSGLAWVEQDLALARGRPLRSLAGGCALGRLLCSGLASWCLLRSLLDGLLGCLAYGLLCGLASGAFFAAFLTVFFAALRAGAFLAAFLTVFFAAALRAGAFFAAFLTVFLAAALRTVFLTVFFAALRAGARFAAFLAVDLRAVFFAATRAT